MNFSAKLNDFFRIFKCYVYLGILNFRAKNSDFVKVQNQQKLKSVEFLTIFGVKFQIMIGINLSFYHINSLIFRTKIQINNFVNFHEN